LTLKTGDARIVLRALFPAGMMRCIVGFFAPRILQSPIEILAVGRPRNGISISRIAIDRSWRINRWRRVIPAPMTTGRVNGCRSGEITVTIITAEGTRTSVVSPVPIPG
jgi:hypothetical protein